MTEQNALRRAFPSSLAADVDAALALVSPCPIELSADDIGPVRVAGEALYIPSRIYSPEPPIDAQDAVTETAKMILGCLYTRHSDGRIREKHLGPSFRRLNSGCRRSSFSLLANTLWRYMVSSKRTSPLYGSQATSGL